jgi:hypothetical protein
MRSALRIVMKIGLEKIGKEKGFQNDKHNKNFNKYDFPQRTPDVHGAKTFAIQIKETSEHISPPNDHR